jgi:hypothetical protein
LNLDDIIAQLSIETLLDLDEEEEDDEGLAKDADDDTDIIEISKLEVFTAALHRLSQLLLRGREKKETRDRSGMLETQPKIRGSMSRKKGNLQRIVTPQFPDSSGQEKVLE